MPRSRVVRSLGRVLGLLALALTVLGSPTDGSPALRVAPAEVSYNNALYTTTNGFDTCAAKTNQMLSDWFNGTPWYDIGVYLGGSEGQHKKCYDGAFAVDLALSYGYGVTLYWFGPQIGGTCPLQGTGFTHFFSGSDTTAAYNAGVAEADSASSSATAGHLPVGSRIFYDMEAYSGTSTCRAAAKSFINGWDHELNVNTPFFGAAYGSSCGSSPADWATIANVPIAISPADANANLPDGGLDNGSAFGYPCLSDAAWTTHQRVGQFSIDFGHKYGSTTQAVDENCADSYLPSNSTAVSGTCSDVL